MSNKITPNEFHLLNDNPVIRTNCLREYVTDEMVAQRVKAGNLVAGDRVLVQCFSHDYSELLAEAEYRVISRKTTMRTDEISDIVTRQYEHTAFGVCRVSDWLSFADDEEPELDAEPVETDKPRRGRPPKAREEAAA